MVSGRKKTPTKRKQKPVSTRKKTKIATSKKSKKIALAPPDLEKLADQTQDNVNMISYMATQQAKMQATLKNVQHKSAKMEKRVQILEKFASKKRTNKPVLSDISQSESSQSERSASSSRSPSPRPATKKSKKKPRRRSQKKNKQRKRERSYSPSSSSSNDESEKETNVGIYRLKDINRMKDAKYRGSCQGMKENGDPCRNHTKHNFDEVTTACLRITGYCAHHIPPKKIQNVMSKFNKKAQKKLKEKLF